MIRCRASGAVELGNGMQHPLDYVFLNKTGVPPSGSPITVVLPCFSAEQIERRARELE